MEDTAEHLERSLPCVQPRDMFHEVPTGPSAYCERPGFHRGNQHPLLLAWADVKERDKECRQRGRTSRSITSVHRLRPRCCWREVWPVLSLPTILSMLFRKPLLLPFLP